MGLQVRGEGSNGSQQSLLKYLSINAEPLSGGWVLDGRVVSNLTRRKEVCQARSGPSPTSLSSFSTAVRGPWKSGGSCQPALLCRLWPWPWPWICPLVFPHPAACFGGRLSFEPRAVLRAHQPLSDRLSYHHTKTSPSQYLHSHRGVKFAHSGQGLMRIRAARPSRAADVTCRIPTHAFLGLGVHRG